MPMTVASRDRLYGSEICRRQYLRQMGKHQRIFRKEKGRGIDVAVETLKTKHKPKKQ